jgi:EpsI family protein
MTQSMARFLAAALLIMAAAIFLQARTHGESFPPRLALQSFPQQLGDWSGTDVPIEPDTLQVLGPGDFLLRVYADQPATQPPINLFLAYFPTQRAGDTIHSPKNCLPGAGWAPVHSDRIVLSTLRHLPFPVNRYVIAKGNSRQLILYWYWAHDRGVASEYWAKYYLVADSIKMNRSDGALVRIGTTIGPDETLADAEKRVLPFVDKIVPLLDDYIPR